MENIMKFTGLENISTSSNLDVSVPTNDLAILYLKEKIKEGISLAKNPNVFESEMMSAGLLDEYRKLEKIGELQGVTKEHIMLKFINQMEAMASVAITEMETYLC